MNSESISPPTAATLVTRTFLNQGKSSRGAWSKAQLRLLGVSYPLAKGWAKQLIGTYIARDKAERFIQLKDAHLKNGSSKSNHRQSSDAPSSVQEPPKPKPCSESQLADGFVLVKTQAGYMCEAVLRTIYPMRELFTRAQIQDAGYFIKRIGYDKTCQIADWAARKSTIKDGRYRLWLVVCRKEISAQAATN